MWPASALLTRTAACSILTTNTSPPKERASLFRISIWRLQVGNELAALMAASGWDREPEQHSDFMLIGILTLPA
jgi:hypothetical protein